MTAANGTATIYQNRSAPANGAEHGARHGPAPETSMDDFEVPDQVEEVSHVE